MAELSTIQFFWQFTDVEAGGATVFPYVGARVKPKKVFLLGNSKSFKDFVHEVTTTLYSIINSTTRKYCSIAFI